MRKRGVVLLLFLFAGAGFSTLITHQAYLRTQESRRQRLLLESRRKAWDQLRRELWVEIHRFPGEAGVLIEDLDTRWRLVHQPERPFPAASIIKVPIMAACFQAVEEGKIRLSDPVVLRSVDKVAGSGLLKAEKPGATLTVEQLIELMITESDNTATNLLIGRLGFDYLNSCFEREGLRHTKLSRRMMDFSERKKGVENYTTAEDIAIVLRKIYAGELIRPEVSKRCMELLLRQSLKDRIPARLPRATPVAHKTGLERGVCHDSGIVFTGGGNYLISVLTRNQGASPPSKRFIARLSALAYRYMTAHEEL